MRGDRNGFLYAKLSPGEMLQHLTEFEALLAGFNSTFRGMFDGYTYSIQLISEIYKRIDQRADYYLYFHSDPEKPMKMSQAKEIALMAFWILKYKPCLCPQIKRIPCSAGKTVP